MPKRTIAYRKSQAADNNDWEVLQACPADRKLQVLSLSMSKDTNAGGTTYEVRFANGQVILHRQLFGTVATPLDGWTPDGDDGYLEGAKGEDLEVRFPVGASSNDCHVTAILEIV